MIVSTRNGLLTILAGIILMFVLGSIHAFSVFLEPLENRFAATRGEVSITYSMALVCLTASVFFGHHFFKRFQPQSAVIIICSCAAIGCLFASFAASLVWVWLSYSVMFGVANGLGYALSLQTSAQANPEQKGLAMGIITASYALGAAVSPVFFDLAMDYQGYSGAMLGLSLTLVMVMPISFFLLKTAKARLEVESGTQEGPHQNSGQNSGLTVLKLWLGYGAAVTAGLMVIGHASGIARIYSSSDFIVLLAPILIAILNMAGSLLAGILVDRMSARVLLLVLPAVSALILITLAITQWPLLILICLSLIGFTYGATISIYPAAVSNIFGSVEGVRVYGRVFTAWGMAGILGPVVAGILYQNFGSYELALILAAVLSLVSAVTIRSL